MTTLRSTRSREGIDAHRDMDFFDENAELRLFREAIRQGKWKKAAEFAANIDEHMTREGPIPMAWLSREEFTRLKASTSPMAETATRRHKILAGSPRRTAAQRMPTNAEFKADKRGYVDVAPVPERPVTERQRKLAILTAAALRLTDGWMPGPAASASDKQRWQRALDMVRRKKPNARSSKRG